METDDIRLGENFFNGAELDAELRGFVRGKDRVETEDPDLETGEAFGEETADIAETEDANGLAREFTAHEFGFFPFAGAGRDIGGNNFAVGGQRQGDDFFGHAVGIGARSVHHIHIFPTGIFGVDIVESGSGTDHQAQRRQLVHDFRRDFFTADDDHFRIGIFRGQVGNGFFRILHHGKTRIAENSRNFFIQFRRDQHFFHL